MLHLNFVLRTLKMVYSGMWVSVGRESMGWGRRQRASPETEESRECGHPWPVWRAARPDGFKPNRGWWSPSSHYPPSPKWQNRCASHMLFLTTFTFLFCLTVPGPSCVAVCGSQYVGSSIFVAACEVFFVVACRIFSCSMWVSFPCSSASKESADNAGDLASIPQLGRCPGEGKG